MTRNPFLNKTILSCRPLIVGTLTGNKPLSAQLAQARSSSIDAVELRLDTFPINRPAAEAVSFSKDLLARVKTGTRKSILLTIRAPRERGSAVPSHQRHSDQQRRVLFEALLPLVSAIDVEISSAALARRLSGLARRRKVAVIHSYHDFKTSGRSAHLNRLRRTSLQWKGNFFKVAVMPGTNDELETFMNWGSSASLPRPVLIGMGTVGLPSRFMGFSFGSAITYGHLGASAAPGQVPVKELGRIIRELYSCS